MGGLASLKLFWKDQRENISAHKLLPLGPCLRFDPRQIPDRDFSLRETKEEAGTEEEAPTSPVDRGVEPAEEFTPIEHPMEPPENDQPVRCPQPEPCIMHDGRIWKERLQLSMKRRGELRFIREHEAQGVHRRRHTASSERIMLPSESASTGAITKFLE